VLLLFSVEFYDSASSWRGNDVGLHFRLATIAATSYVFGIYLALVGASMLLCLRALSVGGITTFAMLVAVIATSQIQRELWWLYKGGDKPDDPDHCTVVL
jgi:hypothetical protein